MKTIPFNLAFHDSLESEKSQSKILKLSQAFNRGIILIGENNSIIPKNLTPQENC
jgi:hypothetical protein